MVQTILDSASNIDVMLNKTLKKRDSVIHLPKITDIPRLIWIIVVGFGSLACSGSIFPDCRFSALGLSFFPSLHRFCQWSRLKP
jgi:hypothetical protein